MPRDQAKLKTYIQSIILKEGCVLYYEYSMSLGSIVSCAKWLVRELLSRVGLTWKFFHSQGSRIEFWALVYYCNLSFVLLSLPCCTYVCCCNHPRYNQLARIRSYDEWVFRVTKILIVVSSVAYVYIATDRY